VCGFADCTFIEMPFLSCFQVRQPDGSFALRYVERPNKFEWTQVKFPGRLQSIMDTLERLGLVEVVHSQNGEVYTRTIAPELVPGLWHPPSVPNNKCVQTIPPFQFVMGSQTNVQCCASRGAICYVCKYVSKGDLGRYCLTKVEKDMKLRIKALPQYNVGRTSSAIAEERIRAEAGQSNCLLREISSSEMSMAALGLPYHITNVHFVHASTQPLEFRVAGVKTHAVSKVHDEHHALIPVTMRQTLNDVEQQFTLDQQMLMDDFGHSAFHVDNTTSYSLRPPPLFQFLG